MKPLLLPILAAIALPNAVEACILGNCGSEYEARQACQKWASKGKTEIVKQEGKFTGTDSCSMEPDGFIICDSDFGGDIVEVEIPLRSCNSDYGSKKILGIEKSKVKKRFKY